MKRFLSLCVILFTSVIFFVQADADQKTVVVKRKQRTFQVVISANRTTGYSWFLLNYDDKFVRPIKQKFIPPASELIGAPGQSEWTFKLTAAAFTVPTATKIVLLYARPWDMSTAVSKTIWVVSDTGS